MLHNALSRARNVRRDEGGFTLIELLIVIIILGVLAAVVVFSVRGITDTGEESACKTEYRTVQTAIEAFYANDPAPKNYPATLAALVPNYLREAPSEYVSEADYTAATGALADPC